VRDIGSTKKTRGMNRGDVVGHVEVLPGQMKRIEVGPYLHAEPQPQLEVAVRPHEASGLVCSRYKIPTRDGYRLVYMCENWGQRKVQVTVTRETDAS
jgi:hypothetical protein